jgi:hypothetical protein
MNRPSGISQPAAPESGASPTVRGATPGGVRGELALLRERLWADAAEWRIGRTAALAFLLVPLVGAFLVALARLDLSVYTFLVAEDSLLEWAQVGAYLAASVGAVLVAVALSRTGGRLALAAYVVLALGCFFAAGEEIAWGQRVLGLETPEGLAAVNMQNEITVHNIGPAQTAFHGVQVLAGAFGSLGAWLIRRRPRIDRARLELFVPPLFLASAFFLPLAYRLIRVLLFPAPEFTVVKYGEWSELCFAAALAAFALLGWRRLRAPGHTETGAADAAEHGASVR